MLSVPVGDLRIAYRETGEGDAVLFINGTGESGKTWDAQMRALTGHRCVAIDNRDTGDSSYVEQPYTPSDLAGDAAGVIETLGLAPCHVVGYSLGGAAAQELAIARPELVRSLVLLSTWARTDGWFAAQMRNWQAIRRAHWDDDVAFLLALETWLFSPATFANDELRGRIYVMWAEEQRQLPDGWIRQTEADIAHDALSRLDEVRVPALVIVGEDDVCTPPRYAVGLAEALPRAELVRIPNAGHCAVFERPDVVARAIAGFVATQG
ncbi:MAG: alpha/beta fold hydrolase [Actinomycetota bacterium]